jgi:hypothetical protein
MNTNSIGNRALTALLLAALAGAALAPDALADGPGRHPHGRPAFRERHVTRVVHRGPYFIERHSDAGAIVGFLGGLVVGSILASAPPAPPPAYDYYDPYCDERFLTIEAYDEHLCGHRHPRSVEVVEVHGGRYVATLDWRDGRWCNRDEHPRYEEWDD